MALDSAEYARIAQDIIEKNTAVALRVRGEHRGWDVVFMTQNIAQYGYRPEDFTSGAICWGDIIHPDDRPSLTATLAEYEAIGMDRYSVLYRILTARGEPVWVLDHSTVTRDGDGRVLHSDCVVSDYTKMKESLDKIEDNYKQQTVLNDILQSLHTGNLDQAFDIILSRTGKHLNISRVLLFKDTPDRAACEAIHEWCNEGIPSMLNPDYRIEYREAIPEIDDELGRRGRCIVDYGDIPAGSEGEFAAEGVIATAVFAVYRDGERYGFLCFDECAQPRQWDEDTLFFLETVAGLVSTAVLRMKHEEEIVRAQEHIRGMAFHDHLTKLPNRYRCDQVLQGAIDEAIRSGGHGFLLFIDMDDFKIVNDGYGHDYGDALLIEFAAFLSERFGDVHQVFRFGGDEFVVLIDDRHAGDVQRVVDALIGRAGSTWNALDKSFYCTVSIGVVRYPDGDCGAREIMKNADIAMYKAKNMGKNSYVLFDDGLDDNSIERVEMESLLRDSIAHDFRGFEVHYQPILDTYTQQITGAEALIRLRGADTRMIAPGQFIPLSEYLGLIVNIGEFVLRDAAAKCKIINESGYPDFRLSVNVSIRQFQQPDFIGKTEAILRETGVDPHNIVLEVTEGLAINDMQRMMIVCDELRKQGVRIAMDDFGTGYSSLSNMRNMPVDIVKIDRSFIRDVTTDPYSHTFIRLITELSHSMDKSVCIEGVETEAQLRYSREAQANTIQGFYFYEPLLYDDLLTALRENKES